MHSVSSFSYMLANSFCAFLCFRALVLVEFFLLRLEAVFTSVRFSLTANVFHGTLYFVLCLVGMNPAAASRCVMTKFSYSSFGVCVFVFSCKALYLFLSANVYNLALLNNRHIRVKYVLELRNRFEALQKTEKGTTNNEYKNFVNAHHEAAANCIPTKPRTEYRVPWET